MNKTYETELRRVFLIENLPEPLTRASQHLQIFDNYIENTRLRLRSIRIPETKEWTWILEQRSPLEDLSQWKVSRIFLNETEHIAFEIFEGREVQKNERVETNEIRKNRYFYECGGKQFEIDVFLGKLWGLNLAKVYFESLEEISEFKTPPFALSEVTTDEFFIGRNLIGKTFAEVRLEFEKSLNTAG
jgi:CYTH domain-containing protein